MGALHVPVIALVRHSTNLGFGASLLSFHINTTPLVAGVTQIQVLAESMAIAGNPLNHCATQFLFVTFRCISRTLSSIFELNALLCFSLSHRRKLELSLHKVHQIIAISKLFFAGDLVMHKKKQKPLIVCNQLSIKFTVFSCYVTSEIFYH